MVILYLMGLFIFGYLFFDIILIVDLPFPVELVTGCVFLGGAAFVFIIMNVSQSTIAALHKAEEIIRVAKDDWESTFDAVTDIITVHAEACTHLHRTLQQVRALGKRAGVSLNPHTPPDCLRYILPEVDLILVMSVNPGFGGQSFIPSANEKLAEIRTMIDASGFDIDLEVDGGVKPGVARQVVEAGADVIVAGSAVFNQDNYAAAVEALRRDAE